MLRIVLFLLKCIVGVLATLGLLVAAALVVGFFAWQDLESWRSEEALPERFVLLLDLDEGIVDGPPSRLPGLAALGGGTSLRDLTAALETARSDPAVAGLAVRLGQAPLSLAEAQTLRRHFARFAEGGKPAVAFAESFGGAGNGTLPYYLASGLGEVWLQPSGDLNLTGFRIEQPYLRTLLDDWDVLPRIGQREAYKGAADPMNRDAMAQPVRENLQALLDSWLAQVSDEIATARGLEPAVVRRLIDRAPFFAREAVQQGLVDKLGYWDEALVAAGGGEARPKPVSVTAYAEARRATAENTDGPAVAVIYALGPITLESGDGSPFGASAVDAVETVRAIDAAVADSRVKTIVLRVDSPGGSYVASDSIWRAVRQARAAGKPVVVSMGGVAASGGYFLAAAADRIFAEPGSVTGSIGVVSGKLVLERFWRDLGVNWDGVQAGDNAALWSPNRDFSPEQWRRLQVSLDRVYDDFVGKVAEGRELPRTAVLAVAGGRVWSGRDALERGLVDELGGFEQAVDAARRLAGLPTDRPARLLDFPDEQARYGRLLRRLLGGGIESLAVAEDLRQRLTRLAPLLDSLGPLSRAPGGASLETAPLTHR